MPDELKSLRFVEKLLIAGVRHPCCYVKVASGMCKMKANVIAFQSPIPKVYDVLPPPCSELGLFTVAILGPFSAHFQTHFWAIFEYLAEEQTKRN